MKHDFDEVCFHDNLIHGIIFYSDSGEFSSDIALDVDYIEEWIKTEDDGIFFVISKALLKFHDVTDLKILIDWGETGNSEFSGYAAGVYIKKITREKIYSPIADDYFLWKIETNNHDGYILFGASSFSLDVVGRQQTVNRQFLLRNER